MIGKKAKRKRINCFAIYKKKQRTLASSFASRTCVITWLLGKRCSLEKCGSLSGPAPLKGWLLLNPCSFETMAPFKPRLLLHAGSLQTQSSPTVLHCASHPDVQNNAINAIAIKCHRSLVCPQLRSECVGAQATPQARNDEYELCYRHVRHCGSLLHPIRAQQLQ